MGFPLGSLVSQFTFPAFCERLGISPVATGDKSLASHAARTPFVGYSPLTSPPFEKGGRKLTLLGAVRDLCQRTNSGKAKLKVEVLLVLFF